MTDAAPDDVTLEESGRSERGISAEDSMAAMKSQLKLMKSLHQASTFDLGSVRRRHTCDAARATARATAVRPPCSLYQRRRLWRNLHLTRRLPPR